MNLSHTTIDSITKKIQYKLFFPKHDPTVGAQLQTGCKAACGLGHRDVS